MLFVCLSHFGMNFFRLPDQEAMRGVLWLVGMVASPTFMLISGLMVGLLYETRPERFHGFARTMASRGIFMLTIGHALILLTIIPQFPSIWTALGRGFITDAIGVAILLGPAVVQRLGIRGRVYLSVGLMICAWTMAIAWTPSGGIASAIRFVLAGPWDRQMPLNFPLLAWLAVYFAGTAIGGWLGGIPAKARFAAIERRVFVLGALAVGLAIVVKLGYWVARDLFFPNAGAGTAYMLTSPFQKFPPSPVYVAFYGGVGLLITSCLLFADRRRIPGIVGWLSMLGRSSLFVFLLQFFVYNLGLRFVDLEFQSWWFVYYAVTVLFITMCAKVWDDRGANRWFNVLDWFKRDPSAAPFAEGWASRPDPRPLHVR